MEKETRRDSAFHENFVIFSRNESIHKIQDDERNRLMSNYINRYFKFMLLIILVLFALSSVLFSNSGFRESSITKIVEFNITKEIQRNPALVKKDPTIYFIWTTESHTFKYRHFKVIDSYFYHHPQSAVIVYATFLPFDFFSKYVLQGYNIQVKKLSFELITQWSSECPGEKWVSSVSKWSNGPFFYSHLTDYVRFCLLYRFGGVYSDLDAILLNTLPASQNFIGLDATGDTGTTKYCSWCLFGGHKYLAPGLMGTSKAHLLPYTALEIGFSGSYNPSEFNGVGPKAVTRAFVLNSRALSVNILQTHIFYPLPWNKAHEIFHVRHRLPALSWLNRLRAKSKSLHLFGHVTRQLQIEKNSLADVALAAFALFRFSSSGILDRSTRRILFEPQALSDSAARRSSGSPESPVLLNVPTKYIGLSGETQRYSWLKDLRVVSHYNSTATQRRYYVTAECVFGRIMSASVNRGAAIVLPTAHYLNDSYSVATANNISPLQKLRLGGITLMQLNAQLSRLLYIPPTKFSRDSVTLTVESAEQAATLAVYNLDSLVTVLIKTTGRMTKVFSLISSIKTYYPGIRILVADDAPSKPLRENSNSFTYVELRDDAGLSAGRNELLKLVKTEYFFIIDDDFVFDEASKIETLVHALEIAPEFHIAAGKSVTDEENFGVDFSGVIQITKDKHLHLVPQFYSEQQETGCLHVDIVPNIFVARTFAIRDVLGGWDEQFKVGEHEDFFLRAKQAGIKTLTCASVTFLHDQDPFWLNQTEYDRKRLRVYEYWKMSLRKHGLTRLVSFSQIVMDISTPQQIENLRVCQRSRDLVLLCWDAIQSTLATWKLYVAVQLKSAKSFTLNFVVRGNETSTWIGPFKSGADRFLVSVVPSNGFVNGSASVLEVPPLSDLNSTFRVNLLQNANFELGYWYWKAVFGSTFHPICLKSHTAAWAGRTQISTRYYGLPNPAVSLFYQTVPIKNSKNASFLDFYASSKVERIFQSYTAWYILLQLQYSDGAVTTEKLTYESNGNRLWQRVSTRLCLAPFYDIKSVHVTGVLESYRGSILWRDFHLSIS